MKFIAEDDQLIVEFQGAEKFFAIKSRLIIPRESIVSLEWHPDFKFERRVIRLGGSDIPGVLYAGRYRGGGESYFLYLIKPRGGLPWFSGVFKSQNTLVIATQDYPYKQILLTCQPDIAAGLLNWQSTRG
jgi:hypothetical protein